MAASQRCTRCGSPAYVGASVVECSLILCRLHPRVWHVSDPWVLGQLDHLMSVWKGGDAKLRATCVDLGWEALGETLGT